MKQSTKKRILKNYCLWKNTVGYFTSISQKLVLSVLELEVRVCANVRVKYYCTRVLKRDVFY